MNKKVIRIVLADDHAIVRNGIKSLLSSESDLEIVGEASDGVEAIEAVKTLKPDLVIMDINMPNQNGLDAIDQLRKEGVDVRCLVLSMHESEDYVLRALDVGAEGYVLKDTSKDHFLKAIHTVVSGGKYFSGSVSEYLVQRLLDKSGPKPIRADVEERMDADLSGSDEILTRRERQILQLVVQGLSNKDIAEKLGKSIRTIEAHRFNLMKKMEAKNLAELIMKSKAILSE